MEFVNAKDIIPPIDKEILIRRIWCGNKNGEVIWLYFLAKISQPSRLDKKFAKDYFRMLKIPNRLNCIVCKNNWEDCELDFDYCILENPIDSSSYLPY